MELTPQYPPFEQRRVPLEGAVNFRDLGGYATADGRRVRWRALFRSDALGQLTDADREVVAGLGLRSLCDLRDADERAAEPNRHPRGELTVHEIGFTPHGGEGLYTDIHTISTDEIEQRLREIFRGFVTHHTATYARLLEVLLEPEALPAVIHCASGRDRTGFASAVILTALGVPRETVVEDYALSDDFRRDISSLTGSGVDPAKLDTLNRTHPGYLAASFEAMDAYGSPDAYLRDGLGLDAERQRRLQERLLEPDARTRENA